LGDGGIVLDPDAHVAGDAEEGADVGEGLTLGPVTDLGDLGVVRNAAFIIALVPKDSDFWDGDGDLLGRDSGTGAEEVVEDAMDIVQVFPNEAADLWVSRSGFVPTILGLIVCHGPFDAGVVYKGNGGVWDFRLEDKQDVAMEDRDSACPSLQ
jgi:hypothetical protein